MHTVLTPEIKSIVEALHFQPAISTIQPFEPKMSGSNALVQSLKTAARKIEKELLGDYPSGVVLLMMQKLNNIFRRLNYNTHKKSIAIYLSPVYEKVLYLDIAVEEKITVDDSFEIRDLVYCKKQSHGYLLLQLSGRENRIYLGSSTGLVKIVSGTSGSGYPSPKKTLLHNLLQQLDNTLHIILQAYPLPLFVIGPGNLLGPFREISKHSHAVVEYIHGDYCGATEKELNTALRPHIADWNKVIQKDLRNQLNVAASAGKLVTGMDAVRRDAAAGKGRLLLVEKKIMYTVEDGDSKNIYSKATTPVNHYSCTRNTVDDTIEKVLENGGDVEFTDQDFLQTHDYIALIKYD
jgi:hypothetical protein